MKLNSDLFSNLFLKIVLLVFIISFTVQSSLIAQSDLEAIKLAKELVENEKIEDAIDILTIAIKADPLSKNLFFERGKLRFDQRDYYGAAGDFGFAIEIDNDFAESFNYKGLAIHYNGDPDLAIEYFSKAIELNPGYIDAYSTGGLHFTGLERMKMRTLISRKPFHLILKVLIYIITEDLSGQI